MEKRSFNVKKEEETLVLMRVNWLKNGKLNSVTFKFVDFNVFLSSFYLRVIYELPKTNALKVSAHGFKR